MPMPYRVCTQLNQDTVVTTKLALSEGRLMRDFRFLWLPLVPQRAAVSKIFDLSPEDQQILAREISLSGLIKRWM
ncbi:hypothetical protein [Parvularcula sp. IMCC14364]|uniref:hypothetical protein n=1 Tax=Parvularcula sp. IMCC14364 TaxID=3067902 RepID=UPI0027413C34|nr:hypothetical protein [Parvularcula sp. IMCC14364]